jgi:two-component system, OmpR family, sensor histidine kinase MtrB
LLHIRSLRFRIAATFIVGTLVVSGSVAVATYLLVSRQLTQERVNSALNLSYSKLSTATDAIRSVGKTKAVTAAFIRDLLQRQGDVVVVGVDGVSAASSAVFDSKSIPAALREAVKAGKVGLATTTKGPRRLVFGSFIPESNKNKGEIYFAYSLATVDRVMNLMRKIFLAVIGAAALAAAAVGLRLASATIRPLRLTAEAAHGVAAGDLSTRLDVSGEDELAQLSNAFNRMTEALEERMARERRFVADVSHELRTPLTTLKTSIDFLADRVDDMPAKFSKPMALAAEEVRSLQRLVDDLLELSRMEAGGVMVASEEVDLVNFASELTRRRAPGANVSVSGPTTLIVRTDKTRLERVVGNLLENAVFHGGDEVEIGLERSDGIALITVRDHGPGIDPEKLPRIFERFWRGDTSRTRDGRIGSGLGLSIARENAIVIGADIDVASEPGYGTRFEVRIPTGTSS